MEARRILFLIGRPLVIICLVGFGPLGRARADVAFMPGDAFFHAELTGAFLDRLPADGGNLILSYSHPLDSAAFGGFAGFERLEIKGVTPRMVSSLRSRYAELRLRDAKVVRIDVDTKGNEVATETNGFHLFVYNRDVSWAEQRIGNKYNENWMNLPPQAVTPARSRPSGFARAPAVRYVSFLSSYEGAVDDWKNAGRFPELRARVPNGIPWGLSGPVIVEPVSIDAKDIQLVVCPYEDLLLYFQQDEDLEFFTISADGDKRFVWTEEGLMGEQIRGPEARGTTPSAGERGKGERGKGQASP